MAGPSGSPATAELAEAISRAEVMGRSATGRRFRPWKEGDGSDVGELALEAFRHHGAEGMRLVFDGYRDGFNGGSEPDAERGD